MNPRTRFTVLGLGLVATFAATIYAARQDAGRDEMPEVVDAAARRKLSADSASAAGKSARMQEMRLELGERSASLDKPRDIFQSIAWGSFFAEEARKNAPPPPPPPPAPAPPKPTAPALPFTYLGQLAEGETKTVFLTQGGRAVSTRVGESIDGTYKIESLDENKVVFTYIPLQERQELSIVRPRN